MPHARPQRLAPRLYVPVSCAPSGRGAGRAWTVALGLTVLLFGASAFASGPAAGPAPAKARPAARLTTAKARPTAAVTRIQKIVDAVRRELAVSHDVAVELVPDNPLKASVEPVKGSGNRFRLAIDRRFLEQLSPDELKAVVAHELGHVWIYTHFPYLQTEQLANQIAMRVVTRESLFLVYGKVWADASSAGSLPRFPDERPAAAAGLAPPPGPRTKPEN